MIEADSASSAFWNASTISARESREPLVYVVDEVTDLLVVVQRLLTGMQLRLNLHVPSRVSLPQ